MTLIEQDYYFRVEDGPFGTVLVAVYFRNRNKRWYQREFTSLYGCKCILHDDDDADPRDLAVSMYHTWMKSNKYRLSLDQYRGYSPLFPTGAIE